MLKVIWTIAWKDLRVWRRHPLLLIGSMLVPLSYFLVVFLGAQAVGENPVAIVNLDEGPIGAQLVQTVLDAGVFRVQVASSPAEAESLYDSLAVAAIITIPPDFSAEVMTHQRAPILVQLANINLDLADDIRRAVPTAITDYYHSLGAASPIGVTLAEQDVRAADVPLFQYSVLPLVILVVTVAGIITAGMGATNEWEQRTIKALLLAPIGRVPIIAGKVLSGFLSTFALSSLLLLFGAALNLTRPVGLFWLSTLGVIALGSLMAAGAGIAIGAFFQRKQPVSYASTLAAVWLFALSGGVGVIFFEPQWLQDIAAWDPLTYAIHALQQAVFYQSFHQIWSDVAVLSGTALGAISLGVLALRREMVTH